MRGPRRVVWSLTLLCWVGCAPPPDDPPEPRESAAPPAGTPSPAPAGDAPAGPTSTVALIVTATLDGDTLEISGDTDLPDGALVTYEVHHETFLPVANITMTRAGTAVVHERRFLATAELTGWSAGTVVVSTAFSPRLPEGQQPDAVIARFGASGERLGGENVSGGASQRRVVVRTEIPR